MRLKGGVQYWGDLATGLFVECTRGWAAFSVDVPLALRRPGVPRLDYPNSGREDVDMAYRNPEEGRARDRERFRRRTAERVAQGLCLDCGKEPPAPDHVLCRRGTGKWRAAERARYAKAKAAGKVYGGRDLGKRRRNAHDRTRRRYDVRREAGLRTRCGRHPRVEGHTACEPCRDAR